MTSDCPGIGRRERVALGFGGVLLCGLYVWAAGYRLDPLDEGYFLYTSSRVYAGDLPYRDFSTPYTPLFFYLNALLFRIFELDVVVVRLSVAAARLGLLLLLYLLARRLVPPPFALLPLLMLFVEDQLPGVWETHPAWWATLALVAAVWCGCRYRERGRLRWWIAAGACAALGAGFKQNLGIFTLAALVGLALVEEPALPALAPSRLLARLSGWLPPALASAVLRWAGPSYLLLLGVGVAWMMRAYLDGLLVTMFVAPFLALGLERLRAASLAEPPDLVDAQRRLAATVVRLGLLGLTFVGLTLVWLVPLGLTLGPETPLGMFVGAIETAGYYWPVEELRPNVWPALGLACIPLLVVWVASRSWPGWPRAGLLAALLALGAVCGELILRRSVEVHPSRIEAALLLSVQATGNLVLYLPLAAFWGAFAALMVVSSRRPGVAFTLRWILLAGCLLELNQYPRLDETHLLFSGLLTWLAGAYALWRLHGWLRRGLTGRWTVALYLALLALPLAALWPTITIRYADLFPGKPGRLAWPTPPAYVWLGLPGLSVYEIDFFAEKYQGLATYLAEHSQPGERIFVYPAAPLLYFVVDRPNATRFNHFFPGLLSAADEDETIDHLKQTPASWVIWDSFGEVYWVSGRAYSRLTDYIWDAYEPVESIGGYEIMRRKAG